MKEKDLLNKTNLNQTEISTDVLENSYQTSICANNNIINTPLHSHYQQHTSEGSIKSSLRLLNANAKLGKKLKVIESLDILPKKPAFGCSQVRRLQIFQGNEQKPGPTSYGPDLKNLNETFIHKKSRVQEVSSETKQKKNVLPIFKGQNKSKTKLGFGVGGHIERVSSSDMILKAKGPGPGQYGLTQSLIQSKIKNKSKGLLKSPTNSIHNSVSYEQRLINKMKDSEQSFQNIKLKVKPPGPGSYNLPTFTIQKQENLAKQKWKKRYIEKKQKAKKALEKLNAYKKQNMLSLQQQQRFKAVNNRCSVQQKSLNENRKKKSKQPMSNISLKYKYLRNELKDKTNSFLPRVEQKDYEHYDRGPIYKHLISNSFMLKNDYAFQAHYYRQPEKQSQYMFFKGVQHKKTLTENCCFKSTTVREPF